MFKGNENAIGIIVTCILIIIESMMSSGLAAFDNISEKDIRKQMEEGDKRAIRAVRLMERLQECNSFVVLLWSLLNVTIGFVYSVILSHWVKQLPKLLGIGNFSYGFQILVEIAGMLLLVMVVVLFGNMIPSKEAQKNTLKKVYKYTGIICFFFYLLKPFAIVVDKAVEVLFWITGRNVRDYDENVTEEEIISIVNEGLEQGVLENNEVEMISNIIEMDEKEVRDIMTRRQKIIGLDGNLTLEQAVKIMLEKSFSRFPVYEGDIDNIIGIIFWKDITKHYIQNADKSLPLRQFVRKAYLVPDTQKINVLFEEMQLKKVHMAIAIDEYGQTVGIVAMEDILEEIVGNIFDEFEVDERMIIKQREGKYFIRGLAKLEDVAQELEIDMEEEIEDYDTLNGFLISKIGHIPSAKEKVDIMYKGYEFHVVDVKDNRIRFVRVHKETDIEE